MSACSVKQWAASDAESAVDSGSESVASDDTQNSKRTSSAWSSRKAAKVSMWGKTQMTPMSPAGELRADTPEDEDDAELEVEGEVVERVYLQESEPASEDEMAPIIRPARILEAPDPQVLRSGRIVHRPHVL